MNSIRLHYFTTCIKCGLAWLTNTAWITVIACVQAVLRVMVVMRVQIAAYFRDFNIKVAYAWTTKGVASIQTCGRVKDLTWSLQWKLNRLEPIRLLCRTARTFGLYLPGTFLLSSNSRHCLVKHCKRTRFIYSDRPPYTASTQLIFQWIDRVHEILHHRCPLKGATLFKIPVSQRLKSLE